jgi:hypothetical protein
VTAEVQPELVHVWEPLPRQEAVLSIVREAPVEGISLIGYGGAAGGAKTNLIANLAFDIATQVPGANILVGRQDFLDLQTTTLIEFDNCLPPGLEVIKRNSAPIYRDIRLPEWEPGVYSRVWFRGLTDWQSLMSSEFGWVLIDEGSEVALRCVLQLTTRLRHKAKPYPVTDPQRSVNYKRGIVVGFNPHPSWCVEWFMRARFDKETKELFEKGKVRLSFVPSRIKDNKHLPEGYEDMLRATLAADPYLAAIMIDGDPDAAMGGLLYFDVPSIQALEQYATPPVETLPTFADAMRETSDGVVEVWERPNPNDVYYCGADPAEGKGEDMSELGVKGGSDRNAAQIYRLRGNVQVAEIYGRQEEHQFGKVLSRTCQWYNDALLCIESNKRATLEVVRSIGYKNLYQTMLPGALKVRELKTSYARERQYEYGFRTTEQTRPILLSQGREALTLRVMHPRSNRFFAEAYNFIAGEKPQARQGAHDDVVFAYLLANQARRKLGTGRPTPEMGHVDATL